MSPDLLIRIAVWITMLLASPLVFIVSRLVLKHDPPLWASAARLIAILGLLAFASSRAHVRPLAGYLLAMAALVLGQTAMDAIEQSRPWTDWTRHAPTHHQILADSGLQLITILLMVLTLMGSGLGARDLYLTMGDVGARGGMPFGLSPISWRWLGPGCVLLVALPFATPLLLLLRSDGSLLRRALLALPLALVFAAWNAAQEEFRFRSVFLARSAPLVGKVQAALLTSTLFGLGHWFGHPRGPGGVVLAGLMGFIAAKSMLDTGGFFWAWIMHAVADVFIFLLIVLTGR